MQVSSKSLIPLCLMKYWKKRQGLSPLVDVLWTQTGGYSEGIDLYYKNPRMVLIRQQDGKIKLVQKRVLDVNHSMWVKREKIDEPVLSLIHRPKMSASSTQPRGRMARKAEWIARHQGNGPDNKTAVEVTVIYVQERGFKPNAPMNTLNEQLACIMTSDEKLKLVPVRCLIFK